jgi:3'(2'), 5'-bisphosphate nucleotidase
MPPAVDGAFARWLAGQAGELLCGLRADHGHADPDALRAAGDRQAHGLIVTALARWRPGDGVLSEESDGARSVLPEGSALGRDGVLPEESMLSGNPARDVRSRLAAERVWIVDPLDGTREYGEPGRDDWAVHIALWVRTSAAPCGLAAAAVALPAQYRVLGTDVPPGYPPMSATAAAGGRLRLAASRSRPPDFLTELARRVDADLVPMGSAGAKIAAVISGDVDGYVHAGGQYEWDSAAPVAVALATGLHASRVDGSPLTYNRRDPLLPDLVVCRKDLARRLLAALGELL